MDAVPGPAADTREHSRRSHVRVLHWLGLLAFALLLRVGYATIASGPGTVPYSDPAHYDEIAWNLARGEGYALGAGAETRATAYRPPALPWLTSLVYRAAGHRYDLAVLLQAVFGATVPLLVVMLGTALFGPAAGWVAGWLAAGHPLIVFFSGHLLTENLFTALLLLTLLLATQWLKSASGAAALATGVVCGLASLTRPLALLLPIVLALWAWRGLGRAAGTRGRTVQLGLLFLGLALAVGPWTLRNARVFHAFVPVSTNSGRVLLEGYNARSWDDPVLRGGGAIDVTAEPYATLIALPEVEADRRARAEAVRFARSRAAELPGIALAKLARFWRPGAEGGGTGAWQREGSLLRRVTARVDPVLLWSLIVFPLALWGLWRALCAPDRAVRSLPLFVMAYFSLLAMVFWGGLRPRAPIEPLIVLMAAVGIVDLYGRSRPRVRRGTEPRRSGAAPTPRGD